MLRYTAVLTFISWHRKIRHFLHGSTLIRSGCSIFSESINLHVSCDACFSFLFFFSLRASQSRCSSEPAWASRPSAWPILPIPLLLRASWSPSAKPSQTKPNVRVLLSVQYTRLRRLYGLLSVSDITSCYGESIRRRKSLG